MHETRTSPDRVGGNTDAPDEADNNHEPRLATQLAGVETLHVDTRHGNVAAWRMGTGPVVLLVHDWRDSARLWDPLMSGLLARGRSFVALDLPGHGFSEGDRCLSVEVPDAVSAVAATLAPIDAAGR